MSIAASLAIVAFAALIHASFQLSVSVLTLLSGHAIGAKHTHSRLMQLTTSFVFGACLMTLFLLALVTLVLLNVFSNGTPQIFWAASCGLLLGVALSVWMFYYRREKGTMLWVPRGMAKYLNNRTKSTKSSAEAFGLGLSSVIGEILFIIAPLTISALTIIQLPRPWHLAGLIIYAIISLLPLIVVWMLIGGGHTLGRIQKWRETNKYFLQFVAGAGLIILSLFVYTYQILGNTTAGGF